MRTFFRKMYKVGEEICRSDSSRASWQEDEPDKNVILVTCCHIQTCT